MSEGKRRVKLKHVVNVKPDADGYFDNYIADQLVAAGLADEIEAAEKPAPTPPPPEEKPAPSPEPKAKPKNKGKGKGKRK